MTRLAKPKTDAAPVEPIRRGECYPLAEFKRRTGLRSWSIRQMRREGFRVHRRGGRAFIVADDFFDFLLRAEVPQ